MLFLYGFVSLLYFIIFFFIAMAFAQMSQYLLEIYLKFIDVW